VIPRGLLSVTCADGLWRAYARVGSVLCWHDGATIREARDGLLEFVDRNLVAILATDPTLPQALAAVN